MEIEVAKELESQKEPTTIKSIVDFLALNAEELKELTKCYKEMDSDDSGEIGVSELFAYLQEPQTRFAEMIFKFLDSSGDGQMDFLEFLKMLSTW